MLPVQTHLVSPLFPLFACDQPPTTCDIRIVLFLWSRLSPAKVLRCNLGERLAKFNGRVRLMPKNCFRISNRHGRIYIASFWDFDVAKVVWRELRWAFFISIICLLILFLDLFENADSHGLIFLDFLSCAVLSMAKLVYRPTLRFGRWIGGLVKVYTYKIQMELWIFTSTIFCLEVGTLLL